MVGDCLEINLRIWGPGLGGRYLFCIYCEGLKGFLTKLLNIHICSCMPAERHLLSSVYVYFIDDTPTCSTEEKS